MLEIKEEIKDLDFTQFVTWATGYFVLGLGAGVPVREIIKDILSSFLLNWLEAHGWKRTGETIEENRKRTKK